MIPRTLEPEVMDTAQEARDYDAMDHAQVNRVFVEDFLRAAAARRSAGGAVLDAGTGTAQIPIALCRQTEDWRVTAVDLSAEMLKVAARNVAAAGLQDRVTLERADCKRLPAADATFDAVVSNSIIHHLPEPRLGLAEMLRVLKPGGLLFVRDLLRPPTDEAVERLVAAYAGSENGHQQQMFRASLHAALTLDEVRQQLKSLQRPAHWAAQTTDRHWTIRGVNAA